MRSITTIAVATGLLLTVASSAQALPINVQFYTQGVFYLDGSDPSTGTTSITNGSGSVTVSFAGVGLTSVISPDSLLLQNLGLFTVTRAANSNNGDFDFDTPGRSFQLAIFQSVPSVGTGTLVGLLDGLIKTNGEVDFSGGTSTTIGNVTYALNLGAGNVLTLANAAQGFSSFKALDGNISHLDIAGTSSAAIATPEPASLLLFGTGVVLVARRMRRRKSSV